MREKLTKLRDDIDKLLLVIAKAKTELKAEIGMTAKNLDDFIDYMKGWCDEIGVQLFGIHIVQDMLLAKAGISNEEVKARIDAREAALAEQQRLLREASEKAHAEAEAEKLRQKAEAAGTTEPPESPVGGLDGGVETTTAGAD
jgi:hypothetical protein